MATTDLVDDPTLSDLAALTETLSFRFFLGFGGEGTHSSSSFFLRLKTRPNKPFTAENPNPPTVTTIPNSVEKTSFTLSTNVSSKSGLAAVSETTFFALGSKSGGVTCEPSLLTQSAFPALIHPNGITNKVSKVDTSPPNTKEIAIPLKIGSVIITKEPPIKAKAVIAIGRVLASQECITASTTLLPSLITACLEKSTSKIEFLTTMPASAIKPIIEVAVKSALVPETTPQNQCPGMIPINVKGIGAITIAGRIKLPNNPTISI